MRGRIIRTPKNRDAFLGALRAGKSINAACVAGHMGRRSAYDWRAADETFARAWDEAVEAGTDQLEDEALRRALDTSDTLIIFLLKARRPDKYKDRITAEHTGKDGGPIKTEDVSDQARAKALVAFLARMKGGA